MKRGRKPMVKNQINIKFTSIFKLLNAAEKIKTHLENYFSQLWDGFRGGNGAWGLVGLLANQTKDNSGRRKKEPWGQASSK